MQVEIYHDGSLIGRSTINAADPPMGVAAGDFKPGPDYAPHLHAGEIEGLHNPIAAGLFLEVRSAEHGRIECQGVFIQNYQAGLGDVSVFGIPYPEYEDWFGDDPAFKAYYGRA